MVKVLVSYYSGSGNTKKMAEYIAEAAQIDDVEVVLKKVEDTSVEDFIEADGIILGSPTYYGSMAAELKKLIDESVQYHGRLIGKIGGAFTSSGNIGGGNETTILDILNAFLIHGMIIQGDPLGDHYGPVDVGNPDARCKRECKKLGQRVAQLAKKIRG